MNVTPQVHGSYYALAGGSVHEALVDLTGGVGFKVKTDTPEGQAAAADGGLWTDLLAWLGSKSIIGAVAKRAAPARQRFRPGERGENTVDAVSSRWGIHWSGAWERGRGMRSCGAMHRTRATARCFDTPCGW